MCRTAARALRAGPMKRTIDDRRDCTVGTQGPEWSASAEEQRICLRRNSSRLYVGSDCLADLMRQRQPCLTAALAADLNPGALPINIRQTHLNDIACAEAKAGEQK